MPIDRVTGQALSYTSATPRTKAASESAVEAPPPPPPPPPPAVNTSTSSVGRVNIVV